MTYRYKHRYGRFGAGVLRSDEMREHLRARAERIAAEFEATAPRDTGHYASSARVKAGKRGGPDKDRAYGRVEVTDDAAMSIEFGHATPDGTPVPGHHTLTRALDAAGD